jgi:hypothetical protein
MTWRWMALPAALAVASCAIPIDTRGSAAIPTEVAVARLRDLLPTAVYVGCTEPRVLFGKDDLLGLTVNEKGVEIRIPREEPFRLLWSDLRGAELLKFPLSYEVRVTMATPANPRKYLYRFSWKEEEPARRAVELLEALRGDR